MNHRSGLFFVPPVALSAWIHEHCIISVGGKSGQQPGPTSILVFHFFSCGEKGQQSMKEAFKITLRLSSASMMEYAQKSFYAIGIKVRARGRKAKASQGG